MHFLVFQSIQNQIHVSNYMPWKLLQMVQQLVWMVWNRNTSRRIGKKITNSLIELLDLKMDVRVNDSICNISWNWNLHENFIPQIDFEISGVAETQRILKIPHFNLISGTHPKNEIEKCYSLRHFFVITYFFG